MMCTNKICDIIKKKEVVSMIELLAAIGILGAVCSIVNSDSNKQKAVKKQQDNMRFTPTVFECELDRMMFDTIRTNVTIVQNDFDRQYIYTCLERMEHPEICKGLLYANNVPWPDNLK